MNKDVLKTVVEKLGNSDEDQIEGLLKKLNILEATGKYAKLLKSLSSANDKSNFLAYVFEASFAFQFET